MTSEQRRKRFVPLENNPDVMNPLVHGLGLSTSLAFQDVFSIDDPDLLAFVSRPAYALLLVFPYSDTYKDTREEEDQDRQQYTGKGDAEEVLWFKQTIGNACGLIGLLHCATNGKAKSFIKPNSDLAAFIESAIPLDPTARAQLLEESQTLESAHATAAAKGQTSAPSADDKIDLHYVCFIKSGDGHLWEMDGMRKGPIDRGALDEEDDVLSEKALDLGPRRFMKREKSEARFSLMALAPAMD